MSRIKSSRGSAESRDRLNQRQYIKDKELQKINRKLSELNVRSNQAAIAWTDRCSKDKGLDNDSAYSRVKESMDSTEDQNRNESRSHTKSEEEKRYFEEVLDQLKWKYGFNDKNATNH